MSGTLTFPIDDTLKSIVEHAAATDPGPFYGEKIERSVFLVKDRGAYLMSGGQPRQMREDGKGCVVSYAEGHNPDTGDYDYDRTRDICGGDDFGEPLDPQFFRSAITLGATEIRITFEGEKLVMESK